MKITIILPYFGKFNNYFKFWLESCANNKNISWMIFTDEKIPEIYPKNVTFIEMTLEKLKKIFEKKLKTKINLERPYKLCDYKPYYGYLFSEYLQDADFWGYCDCDLIFGDILKFITEDQLKKYDKILRTGHLSLIRNKKEINENFLKYDTYKIVIKSSAIYGYDESVGGYHLGFAGELLDKGYKFLDDSTYIADIDFRHYPFYVVSDEQIPCVFIYDHGHIYKVIRKQDKLYKEEMMYLHLQKRKMKVIEEVENNRYIIAPNEICLYDELELKSEKFWKKISEEQEDYFDIKGEQRTLKKRDFIRFLHEPKKIESILYRLKGTK